MKTLLTCLLISLLCLGNITPVQGQNPQKIFQKGLIQEEGEGNLKEAIAIYNSIVNDNSIDRNLRAKALLRVGICHEKLGSQSARKSYQKLISEFSDQKDIVSLGREKLNGLKKETSVSKKEAMVASQLLATSEDVYSITPNGRYISIIDWEKIALVVKDLQTGKVTVITNTGTWKEPVEFPDKSVWSNNGERLAYFWYKGNTTELHIVNGDGSNNRIIYIGENESTPWPVAWSSDDKNILAIIHDKRVNESLYKIVMVSVLDGSITLVKDVENENCSCEIAISPNNDYIVYTRKRKHNPNQSDIYIISMDGSIDKKIVDQASNDKDPVWTPDGKAIVFLSDRFGTNDLWKLKIENGNPIGKAKRLKVNIGERTEIFSLTADEDLYYQVPNTRNDVFYYDLNNPSSDPIKISDKSEIGNHDPIWSNDDKYILYNTVPKFDSNLGFELKYVIYDTETGEYSNFNPGIYSHPNRYRTEYSPDGESLLVHGKTVNEGQGIFSIDLATGTKTSIKVRNGLLNELYLTGERHTYSKDGKSVYYLTPDKKQIVKIDVDSKKESIIYTDDHEILHFKVSNDDSQIAIIYFFKKNRGIDIYSLDTGDIKRIVNVNKNIIPAVLSWTSDDKYLYFQEGENSRAIKRIMRVSVDGKELEQVVKFKDIMPGGVATSARLNTSGDKLIFSYRLGTGAEIWKLEGLLNER
jgi:Tol biopolymer transport system component